MWSAFPWHSGHLGVVEHQVLICGVCNFWSWSKSNGIRKSNELFTQHHTTQDKPTHYHGTRCILKSHLDCPRCSGSLVSLSLQIIESWMVDWLRYFSVAVVHPANFGFCFSFSVCHLRKEIWCSLWQRICPLWATEGSLSFISEHRSPHHFLPTPAWL